jgi:hypothetical protein
MTKVRRVLQVEGFRVLLGLGALASILYTLGAERKW